jgi:hypothetical protein
MRKKKQSEISADPPPSEPKQTLSKEYFYQFAEDDKILMPAKVAAAVELLLKQGTVVPEIEDCYEIIREEQPKYKHDDNSNARKMLTGKVLVKEGKNGNVYIRRLIPLSAYVRILDVLGIVSGKFIPGRQLEIAEKILTTPDDDTQNITNHRKPSKKRCKNQNRAEAPEC